MPLRESLDRDMFAYHAEQALGVARAAESSLRAAEVHLEKLATEWEMNIEVLKDEIEDVRTRGQAARHQVASLRATLQSEGITPSVPTNFASADEHKIIPFMIDNLSSTDHSYSDFGDHNVHLGPMSEDGVGSRAGWNNE